MAKTKKTVVIVGYGGQGKYWHKSIEEHEDWELIGIIDTDTEMLDNVNAVTGGKLDDDMGYAGLISSHFNFLRRPRHLFYVGV